MQPAVFVADFNGDGRMDLLLGDSCGRLRGEPQQSPAEQRRAAENQARLDVVRKQWVNRFQEYRSLESTAAASAADGQSNSKRASLLNELERINAQVAEAQQEVEYDWPRYHTHGFVWVFLRKP
jgi:hypothetical protein